MLMSKNISKRERKNERGQMFSRHNVDVGRMNLCLIAYSHLHLDIVLDLGIHVAIWPN